MTNGLVLPQEAARLWGDPIVRKQILDMHARGDSLLDMVAALKLTDAMDTDGLADVIRALTPAEVQVIRDAFVAEAQLVGDHAGASFPVDCRVDDPGAKVRVTAVSRAGASPVAQITAT